LFFTAIIHDNGERKEKIVICPAKEVRSIIPTDHF